MLAVTREVGGVLGPSWDEEDDLDLDAEASGRVLVVIHVDRGDEIRIISAREATGREKRQYHGEEK